MSTVNSHAAMLAYFVDNFDPFIFRLSGNIGPRWYGFAYVLAFVLVNVAALSLHRESSFGVFHALAVASLVTIGVGISPLLLGRRSPRVIATHAFCMTWSYAGLVAAGCGQLSVAAGQDLAAWVVPAVIGTVLSVCGVAIFGKVPGILDRMPAQP